MIDGEFGMINIGPLRERAAVGTGFVVIVLLLGFILLRVRRLILASGQNDESERSGHANAQAQTNPTIHGILLFFRC